MGNVVITFGLINAVSVTLFDIALSTCNERPSIFSRATFRELCFS